MRLVDMSKKRKNEEQMRSVLENDYIRIESKDGRKIESANCTVVLVGEDSSSAVACGTVKSVCCRTAESLVNLGTSAMTQCNDADLAKAMMIHALEMALEAFDELTAEIEEEEEGIHKINIKRGEK